LIPQADPARRFARFRPLIDAAIADVLSSGQYILGQAVAEFEEAFAAYSAVAFAVGVGSGTDALTLALLACGIGQDDEVVLPALTFTGSAHAILRAGARPIFADVDPSTRCLDPQAVGTVITAKTKAIMPVHLFGSVGDMRGLKALAEEHKLKIIADCAQAHGARVDGKSVATLAHASAYSFYPTKNLGAIGDGGAVLTDDPVLAQRLKALRNYGFFETTRISEIPAFNSRLDELQAAILSVMLANLAEENAQRCKLAALYRQKLRDLPLGLPPDIDGSVYHQFAIEYSERDALRAHLKAAGINTAVHYSPGLHQHPAFADFVTQTLPQTERLASSLLSLPIQSEIAIPAVEQICDAIRSFFR